MLYPALLPKYAPVTTGSDVCDTNEVQGPDSVTRTRSHCIFYIFQILQVTKKGIVSRHLHAGYSGFDRKSEYIIFQILNLNFKNYVQI